MSYNPKHMSGKNHEVSHEPVNKGAVAQKVVKQSFLQGAIILTLSMAIVKAIGALFKIPLANIISENGMGYFGTAYNLYAVLYSLATAGFPIAIARMVAEGYSLGNYNQVRQVKRVSLPIFLITGSIGTLIMILGAGAYTNYVQNPGAKLSIICLAPSIFFCCLASIYKGYYEGISNMMPTAISEVIEALSKFIFGLAGALFVVKYFASEYANTGMLLGKAVSDSDAVLISYQFASAAAIVGVTIGSFLSWVFGWAYFKVKGSGITPEMYESAPPAESGRTVSKKLIAIAVPIAIGSLVSSFAGLVDTSFLLRRLGDVMVKSGDVVLNMYKGLIPAENLVDISTVPNFLYGCYNNGLTIFMLIPTVTTAFGVAALPALTSAWARGDKNEIKSSIESIMRLTSLVSIPAGLGVTALAKPIAELLYGSTGASEIVGRTLVILGIGAIFSAISTPISSMLQAVGRADIPVKLLFIALTIKIAVNYVLCGIPVINIQGAGSGTLCCYLFMTVAETIALIRVSHVRFSMKLTFIKPAICSVICCAAAWGTNYVLSMFGISIKITCLAAIVAAVVVYAITLLIFKAIPKSDILMLPKGEKIAKILEKRGWIG
ncbi:MAG: polysaccharide biosynthesis protein [Clostridia bacterium]|nr:polysaccharide biosynthesis protein [Clostridia bacterium]